MFVGLVVVKVNEILDGVETFTSVYYHIIAPYKSNRIHVFL